MLNFLRMGNTSPESLQRLEAKRLAHAARAKRIREAMLSVEHLQRRASSALTSTVTSPELLQKAKSVVDRLVANPDGILDVSSDSVEDDPAEVVVETAPRVEGRREATGSLIVSTKRKRSVLLWVERTAAVFMYLHPKLFNFDAQRTADAFGITLQTFYGWISTNTSAGRKFISTWHQIIQGMTWKTDDHC